MSATEYYNHSTYPAQGAAGSSAAARAEFEAIETGFGKLPDLAGNGGKLVMVNAGATAMTAGGITSAQVRGSITDETGTGALVFADTPTLVAPLLGTPTSGVLTNCTGTAPGLTAGAATVLANARTIDGVSFNGSANITVIAEATHATTSKATPVDADELPLVDSAASNVLKKLTWANLKATFFAALGALIAAATSKATPGGADSFAIADSAASNATKQFTFTNLLAWLQGAITSLTALASINGTWPSGFKNKIIGGDFTTNPWQRGASFTAPASGSYMADRFSIGNNTDAVLTVLKTADAPTVAQAGVFTQHCLHVDITTADAAIGATQQLTVTQPIEGYNILSLGFGQAGTRYVTISFWHKHTKTGTYCVALRNSALNRSYVAEYTQAVTNTWELGSITVPVDTSGTWLYDNGVGLYLSFMVAAGSSLQTTANAWAAGNFITTANQVNGADNTANDFKIALVQLEAGQVATPFETRSVGEELALCQRYYYRKTPGNGTNFATAWSQTTNSIGKAYVPFPVPMRAAPSALEQTGTAGHYSIEVAGVATACTSVPSFGNTGTDSAIVNWAATAGHTAGQAGQLYSSNASAYLGWSAEL